MTNNSSEARSRFAPSPTGFQHVGGVRTALFAWLVARQAGGKFILRLEDTDQKRKVAGAENHLIQSLKILGLDYDEGPDIGGPFAPYRQSQRLDIYRQWAEKLLKAGRAYADPYTAEQVQTFRDQAAAEKKPFLYRRHRPDNPPKWTNQPLRFKSDPKAYKWQDAVMGKLSAGPEVIDDFILLKSDGFPTYNFAHIVDDAEMKISHVIRGQEFLASVPNYLNLYEALGLDRPILATMPHILNPEGNKKLSKRDGAKDVLEYVRQGYLPAALVNFIASLGWNDGTEQEIFSIDKLIEKFSLEQVNRSGARFDEKRLIWMNGHYIRALSIDELAQKAEAFWQIPKNAEKTINKKKILALVQERLKYLAELPELTSFFFTEPETETLAALLDNPPDKQLAKTNKSERLKMLLAVRKTLEGCDFSREDVAVKLNRLLEDLSTKPGVLFALVRIAVTGQKSSPEIFGTLEVLGKQTALSRIEKSIKLLEN